MSFFLTINVLRLILMTCPFLNFNGYYSKPENLIRLNGLQKTSGSIMLTDYLPRNFVRDGSMDYTSFIQIALIKNPNIVFPDFPVLINDSGLEIPSNRTLTFLKGS